jgi:hypothetical protein
MAEVALRIRIAGVQHSQQGRWKVLITISDTTRELQIENPSSLEDEEDIRWYLEDYALYDPFLSEKAKTTSAGLTRYGERLFAQLELDLLTSDKIPPLRLDIEEGEDAAGFHALHWEILEDPTLWRRGDGRGPPTVCVRRVVQGTLPPPVSVLPSDCIRVLLVVSRHLEPSEAGHRMISKKLFEIKRMCGPGRLDLEIVRPGTFEAFQAQLKRRGPGYYHAVHFDVHGSVVQSGRASKCVRTF